MKADHWDEILQIIKTEEPVTVQRIAKAARKFEGAPGLKEIDSEVCMMARVGAIRRTWVEKEEWRHAEEVFTL